MEDEKVIITNHGERRSKERVGLKKDSLVRILPGILKNGIRIHEFSGSFRRFLEGMKFSYPKDRELIVYGRHIYVVKENILITVIPVRQKFFKIVDIARNKKELLEAL